MKIETKPLGELIPADYNPRMISDPAMAGLEASIKRFGLVEPVVWNERTGHVVGGHQRLKVLGRMGETETEVIVVDLPESEERALNVTLNNPHITGTFTPELQPLLDEIKIEIGDAEFLNLKLDELVLSNITPVDKGIGALSSKFGIPPFSILNAREGWWQERKRAWISLGIQSELGRGGGLTMNAKQVTTENLNYYRNRK